MTKINSPTPIDPAAAPKISWSDDLRQKHFEDWLTRIAQPEQLQCESLSIASADASFRRYLRIRTAQGKTRIIMDAPPDKEDSKPFVRIAGLMKEAGLLVPEVLQWSEAQGFMLLTDLGSTTMMQGMNFESAHANQARYLQAVDTLIDWQLASKPNVLPAYDEALLRRELSLFPDWYLAQHKKFALNDSQKNTLQKAFDLIIERNLAAPKVYVHRDYMPRNLMLTTPDRLGVLDFQDATYGSICYDIASLMRDAFLTWDEDFVLEITVRYWEKARQKGLLNFEDWHSDFGAFYRAVEWMGLQRHLKVAGIFARLTLRDGKEKYLADVPRFITYIRNACHRYRELGPLLVLIDEIEGLQAASGFAYGRN